MNNRWFSVDPDGFQNLAHAYTLFADSHKKNNPRKARLFQLGRKASAGTVPISNHQYHHRQRHLQRGQAKEAEAEKQKSMRFRIPCCY